MDDSVIAVFDDQGSIRMCGVFASHQLYKRILRRHLSSLGTNGGVSTPHILMFP